MSQPFVNRVRQRLAAEGAEGSEAATDSRPHRLPRHSPSESEFPLLVQQESTMIVDAGALNELSAELHAELQGAGPLEPLLALPEVTDVLVNAPDEVWIDCGSGLQRCANSFASDAAIRALAVRLAAQAGRRLDDAAPFVDAALPDGTRLHAILPPLVRHPTISLRVLSRRRLGLADLVHAGTLDAPIAEVLVAAIAARLCVLISGGTGMGKTTLLAALLATVPASERIVTVEDAAELAIAHPHVVSLVARTPNLERAGGIDMAELVRQALRMRVDRLVVGEFRGAEVVELLTALNTGHRGGAATVHANSVQDVPARLIALAALAGMSAPVLALQADSALDVIVQLSRSAEGVRQVTEIGLWPRFEASSGVVGQPRMVWRRGSGWSEAAGELAARIVRTGVRCPESLRAR